MIKADHSPIRAAVFQLVDTLLELEGSTDHGRTLATLQALEGQAGTLQGELRRHRRALSPPGGHQGRIIALVVARPEVYTSGMTARRLGISLRAAYDATRALRKSGWLVERVNGNECRLMPTLRAMQALGPAEPARKGARQLAVQERPWSK